MSLAVFILAIFSMVVSVPYIRSKKIKTVHISSLTVPSYILLASILSLTNSFVGINDGVMVGISFLFIITQLDEFEASKFIYNGIVFAAIFILSYFVNNALWLSISLVALSLFNIKKNQNVMSMIAMIALLLPISRLGMLLYDQWGGLLLLPAMLGLISAENSRDKFILSSLVILIISTTKYISLGYTPVLGLGLFLIILLGSHLRRSKNFIYTIALLPFMGIANPYNIIGIYISINIILFFKTELLKTVEALEVENGSIKNIRYQDIIIVILGLYLLLGGPGSPVFWIISNLKQAYLLWLILFLDIFVINQDCVSSAEETKNNFVNFRTPKEISVLLYIIFMAVVFRESIYDFNPLTLISFSGLIIYLVLYKKRKDWLNTIFSIRNMARISYKRSENHKSIIQSDERKLGKPEWGKVYVDGMDESIIWSFFIFLISILLIVRYL